MAGRAAPAGVAVNGMVRAAGAAALMLAVPAAAGRGDGRPGDTGWPAYGGDPGHSRYSVLDQITPDNVRHLQVAWRYYTGDADPDKKSTIECTPIVVDGTLYLTTVRTRVVALDAATGAERWSYDPGVGKAPGARVIASGVNRGVAYWSAADGTARRILLGTADGRLLSLDAGTGRPDPEFGTAGTVDLRAGLDGDYRDVDYGVTSAPGIFENLVIVGVATPEGPERSAPGDVRAFDVRTGREVWRFHTVPRPGEAGHETWEGQSWKDRGGANPWSGVSVDAASGLVFVATGSPAFDFYGGDRKGTNLFANSVLALEARTGRRRWHFQAVRHDIWDYDLPTPPVLVTLRRGGRAIEAVVQPTKMGHLFVLDRRTGEPLLPVEERPVPASDVPGEAAWPTQPFPLAPPPFSRQRFEKEDATDRSPAARRHVLRRLDEVRHGGVFTPPSLEGTVLLPGTLGGANWSGASFDPGRGTLFVNSSNWPAFITLVPAPGKPYPYGIRGYERFTDHEGYPGVAPPWGLLTALDLDKGERLWQVPLGRFPELAVRGRPRTGTPTFGGSIATASGVVFIGGTMDETFRAFDARNGQLLWEHPLEAGAYATPATYSVGGRQFVVVAAGGGGKLRTRSGDTFVAFALPPAIERAEVRPDPLAGLRAGHPRLLASPDTWARLREDRGRDRRLDGVLRVVESRARGLLDEPPVERRQIGRRLLAVSRAALERVMTLALAYRTTGEAAFARRAQREMLAAAAFTDWNPSHFLDVAEMTAALALGYDWIHDAMSDEARAAVRAAIVENGLRPGLDPVARHNGWQTRDNNWNQVCFGGLTLGALAVAEQEPDLARQVLARARAGIVHGLRPYEPDGVYPEGPGYWSYGTSYQVMMIASLESALGTDWGLAASPGFLESAGAYLQTTGATGLLYNFADGREQAALEPALFWFARKAGRPGLLDRQLGLLEAGSQGASRALAEARRFLPLVPLWWPASTERTPPDLPRYWSGRGPSPIAVFRSSWTDPGALYLALKGGSADVNHGHMDAGSFVLERDGVRWARDLGLQEYESLEKQGVDLWNRAQGSQRWQVFRLNNLSHNTLTIDGEKHRVDGVARITAFSDSEDAPYAVVDLSPVLAAQAETVTRGFRLLAERAVLVQDELTGLAPGASVRWAMVTGAEVAVDGPRAVLREDGRRLEARLLTPGARFAVIPADPPAGSFNAPNPGRRILTGTVLAGGDGRAELAVALGLDPASPAPARQPVGSWRAARAR